MKLDDILDIANIHGFDRIDVEKLLLKTPSSIQDKIDTIKIFAEHNPSIQDTAANTVDQLISVQSGVQIWSVF